MTLSNKTTVLTFVSGSDILESEDNGAVSGDRVDSFPPLETAPLFLYFCLYLVVLTPHISLNGGSYNFNNNKRKGDTPYTSADNSLSQTGGIRTSSKESLYDSNIPKNSENVNRVLSVLSVLSVLYIKAFFIIIYISKIVKKKLRIS